MPEWEFVHVWYNVNLHILRMLEGTFSLDAAIKCTYYGYINR